MVKIPDITKLIGSKNFLLDVGVILLGFAVIGVATTFGTIGAKYIWNEWIRYDVPDSEKVPY